MSILKIVYSAFIHTTNIFRSLAGNNIKNNIYYNDESDININNWNITKVINLIGDIFFIKLPIYCPNWVPYPIKKLFFGDNSEYIPDYHEHSNNKSIIFVNGIMSNKDVVQLNRKKLYNIFKHPINIIYNSSDSLVSDLIECLIGKTTQSLTEASTVALYSICKSLLNPEIKKLIIICHSQGTIIISSVLKNLHKLGLNKEEYLKKLEIYAFSNCASKMNYIINELPYMEHFANEHDFVAKLGCNHDKDIDHLISIDGKTFITKNKYGHMFNSHYMDNFENDYPNSKLLNYINK